MSRTFRKIGKLVLAVLLIISMLSGTVYAAQASSVKKLKFRTAVVSQLTVTLGSAEVVRANDVIPMYSGMRLSTGDTLKTMGDAVAYIMIDQDKIIRLDANSEAELSNTLLGSKVKITLKRGSMFFNVVEKLTEDESLQFVYGNVTMSVRGTSGSLRGALGGAGTTFGVMLYDGKIEVTGASRDGKQQEPTQVTPGQKYEVSQSEDGKVVEKKTSFTLNEIPKSVMAELAKDPALKERVAEGVPASISPSGAVYVKADQINTDVIGTPDEEAMEFSRDIAQNAGIKQEEKPKPSDPEEPEQELKVRCDACGVYVTEKELALKHGLLPCGHHACEEGSHEPAACGQHYQCGEGSHELLPCGKHYKCQAAETDWAKHEPAACGHCAADTETNPYFHEKVGDEYPCQNPEAYVLCPECGKYMKNSEPHLQPCGHYSCEEGFSAEGHKKADCGHYICSVGYVAANHVPADCGVHYTCAAGFEAEAHVKADCGVHAVCEAGFDEKAHVQETTDTWKCSHLQDFVKCTFCGEYYRPEKEYGEAEQHRQLTCGHGACEEGHVESECGHCSCEAEEYPGKHAYDTVTGKYVCQAQEDEMICCPGCQKEYACRTELIEKHMAACGHYFCEVNQEDSIGAKFHVYDSILQQYLCKITAGTVICPHCRETVSCWEYSEDHMRMPCSHYICEDPAAHKLVQDLISCGCVKHCVCQTTKSNQEFHLRLKAPHGKVLCLWDVLEDPQDNWRNYVYFELDTGEKFVSEYGAEEEFECPGCGDICTKAEFLSEHYIWRLNSNDKVIERVCKGVVRQSFHRFSEFNNALYDKTIAKYIITDGGRHPYPPELDGIEIKSAPVLRAQESAVSVKPEEKSLTEESCAEHIAEAAKQESETLPGSSTVPELPEPPTEPEPAEAGQPSFPETEQPKLPKAGLPEEPVRMQEGTE